MLTDLSPAGAQPQIREVRLCTRTSQQHRRHPGGKIKDKYVATGRARPGSDDGDTAGLDDGKPAPMAPITPPNGTSCSWSELAKEPLV